jgi:hypothetical protein
VLPGVAHGVSSPQVQRVRAPSMNRLRIVTTGVEGPEVILAGGIALTFSVCSPGSRIPHRRGRGRRRRVANPVQVLPSEPEGHGVDVDR